MWRIGPGGVPEVLLVHRPAPYDDWSLPKGKREPTDVDDAHCALREVFEETGFRCTLGRELPAVEYEVGGGRMKQVRHWEMTVVSGEFRPNLEIDRIAWLSVVDAKARVSFPDLVAVLDAFCAFAGIDHAG